MYNMLNKMIDYLETGHQEWSGNVINILFFSIVGFLAFECIFISSDFNVYIYGCSLIVDGQAVGYLSLEHISFLVLVIFITGLGLDPFEALMRKFKKSVDRQRCSILIVPAPFIILCFSCLMSFVFKKAMLFLKGLWNLGIVSGPANKRSISRGKTIS